MTLSTESAERIALLFRVAKRNGSLVTVHELSRLLPENVSESEVRDAIASIPSLSSAFELRSGFLTERLGEPSPEPIELEADSRKSARTNLVHASRFVTFLHSSGFRVVAVSGSTSYGSASVSKDTDLFCIAPHQSMWVCLTKALIMARAYHIMNRGAPRICISCVMDDEYARSAFVARRHPLFARDAIEAKVLVGRHNYESLLRTANWISDYYPVAYGEVFKGGSAASPGQSPSSFAKVFNRLLYAAMGKYVQAKSSLLNRRFRRRGKGGDVFGVRRGEDHLIYESKRYQDLKREYEAADQTSLHSSQGNLPNLDEPLTSELA